MTVSGAAFEDQWLQKLVEKNLLTLEQRDNVLREKKSSHGRVFDILVKRNCISERDLTLFLSQELGVPVMNPLTYKVATEVLGLIPLNIVKRYQVIPISRFKNTLTVATSNPLDLIVIDDLAALTGLAIKPMLTMPSLIEEAIKKFYTSQQEAQEDAKTADQSLADIVKDMDGIQLEHLSNKNKAVDLGQEGDETPVIKIANLIVLEAVKRKASDLFVEPWEKHMRIRCRVDGLLEEVKSLPVSMSQAITSRLKVMSNLDIAEHRIPQDGRFKAKIQNREVDFRVSVIPTSFGEKICIRLLDKKSTTQQLEPLGFNGEEIKSIKAAAAKPHGMILITGPTGSGKTTTLYAILNHLHKPEKNLTTVEDPVEYQVHGINQVNVREHVGLTFSAALRSILRQDPNIIMIGEIRDLETMDIAIKAALTGHLVLSTLHTNDASSSVVRMVNMGIEPFLIASSVHLVTAQRLIRKLCSSCKEPLKPTDEILKALKVTSTKGVNLFKPHGCNSCRNTGFSGRKVITEVLSVSQTIRELILQRATGDDIKQAARREGMTTLRESGFEKVMQGDTTIEEVYRITAGDMDLT